MLLSHTDICLMKWYAKEQSVLYYIRKYMHQHTVRISNSAECYKGFIAGMPLVSYTGHPKEVAKRLLQQQALLYISDMPQSISQQQH